MSGSTSPLGAQQTVAGLLLQAGNGSSPETMNTIANVDDFALPLTAKTVETTNVGDTWVRRVATLLDMGKISFTIFWVMEEATHRNSAASGVKGLRYMFYQRVLADFQAVYPDGNTSTDAWPAYVTAFNTTGKTGDVFKAAIDLSNSGAPSLV